MCEYKNDYILISSGSVRDDANSIRHGLINQLLLCARCSRPDEWGIVCNDAANSESGWTGVRTISGTIMRSWPLCVTWGRSPHPFHPSSTQTATDVGHLYAIIPESGRRWWPRYDIYRLFVVLDGTWWSTSNQPNNPTPSLVTFATHWAECSSQLHTPQIGQTTHTHTASICGCGQPVGFNNPHSSPFVSKWSITTVTFCVGGILWKEVIWASV